MLNETVVEIAPQQFKRVVTFTAPEPRQQQAVKAETIHYASVTVDDLTFDANEKSMDRMARWVSAANAQYAKALAGGSDPADAYAAVFMQTVDWRLADNTTAAVTLATLAEALQKAVENMAAVWIDQ